MNSIQARRLIDSFRNGVPPDSYIRHFTVGRRDEIEDLLSRLGQKKKGALLIQANYGSGKTHLLRFIKESALEAGYAVSYVTLDAKSGVRFNRFDQILGAIWRGMELPNSGGVFGARGFLDHLVKTSEEHKINQSNGFWKRLTNSWRWDYSDVLDSPSMFVALRAWATGDNGIMDLVEDWLYRPGEYQTQRQFLYNELITGLRKHFRDPRPEAKFFDFSEGVFVFKSQGYSQSWAQLGDMQTLALESGLSGLVLIFDEFEDVVYNLARIDYQEAAFWNLFDLYSGKRFPGMSFYAVTPDFATKCKKLLLEKERWDFDYSRFEKLPKFRMTPLGVDELAELATKILDTHGIAYGWNPDLALKGSDVKSIVKEAAKVQMEDRARHTIEAVVKSLDRLLEEHEDE